MINRPISRRRALRNVAASSFAVSPFLQGFAARAKDKKEAPLAFVGKGVTFDTGGISIKPSLNMEDMKTDMGGSAVVVIPTAAESSYNRIGSSRRPIIARLSPSLLSAIISLLCCPKRR